MSGTARDSVAARAAQDSLAIPWQSTTRWLAGGAGTLPALALLGWALHSSALKSVLPGAVEMKVNTALALLLAATSIFIASTRAPPLLSMIRRALALMIVAIGAGTLFEYLFDQNLGIDQLLFFDTDGHYAAVPGRMSPYTAVAFVALGTALVVPNRGMLRPLLHVGIIIAGVIGLTSLLGYFWNAQELTTDQWLPPVAVNTGVALTALALATAMNSGAVPSRLLGSSGAHGSRVESKVLYGFLGTLALFCLGGGVTYRTQANLVNSARLMTDAQQTRRMLGSLYTSICDAQSAQRDYLLLGNPLYKAQYVRSAAQIESRMAALHALYRNDASKAPLLRELKSSIDLRLGSLGSEMAVLEENGPDALRRLTTANSGIAEMERIRGELATLDGAEAAVLMARDAKLAQNRSYTLIALLTTLSVATTALLTLFGSIARDIRERTRITEKLHAAQREAQRATQAKSEFLAAMSHEIRTPMNGVIGMLELLQQSSLAGQQLEMVKVTRESADALLRIIDDILDFSKIEAGRLEIESAPIDIADAVEKSCALLNRLAERKQTVLTTYCHPSIPTNLLGDSTRLKQVLINLISNAIKFSSGLDRAGRVSVRACLIGRASDAVTVEFLVTDNGIGMDEPTVARLFSSFMQADASTTRRYGGTGLGLAICKQLIGLMGGTIAVQSVVQQGSAFTVRMPFRLAVQLEQPVESAPHLTGLPCLVVGGSQGLAEDLAAYLHAEGAGVARSADASAVSGWTRAQAPGVAVCVIEAGDELPALDRFRAALSERADLSVRSVLVVVGRSVRNPHAETEGFVVLDGNALGRRTLIDAVATASGRARAKSKPVLSPRDQRLRPPTREAALQARQLILVAEDNDINQRVITEQLGLLGYTADVVANGRQALERWRTRQYALVLADLHMPEMDGYALTLQIRQEEQDQGRTPIIALTANALAGEAERCRAVGMDDYLTKPATLAALASALERWMHTGKVRPAVSEILTSKVTGPLNTSVPAKTASALKATPALDVRVLESLIGNDAELVAQFLRDFSVSAADLAERLLQAYRTDNTAEMAAVAHKLKSSARSVGALKLGELCEAIEEAGGASRVNLVPRLMNGFQAELASVQEQLRAMLAEEPGSAARCA